MLKDTMVKGIGAFFGALLIATILGAAILCSLPITILYGWVLSIIWGWFVAPLGVPAVGVAQASGLLMVVWLVRSLFKTPDKTKVKGKGKEEEKALSHHVKELFGSFLSSVVGAFAVLGIARIFLAFM